MSTPPPRPSLPAPIKTVKPTPTEDKGAKGREDVGKMEGCEEVETIGSANDPLAKEEDLSGSDRPSKPKTSKPVTVLANASNIIVSTWTKKKKGEEDSESDDDDGEQIRRDDSYPAIPYHYSRFPYILHKVSDPATFQPTWNNKVHFVPVVESITLYSQLCMALTEQKKEFSGSDGKFNYDIDLQERKASMYEKGKKSKEVYSFHVLEKPENYYYRAETGIIVPLNKFCQAALWTAIQKGETKFIAFAIEEVPVKQNPRATIVLEKLEGSKLAESEYIRKITTNTTVLKLEFDLITKTRKNMKTLQEFKLISHEEIQKMCYWDVPLPPALELSPTTTVLELEKTSPEFLKISDMFHLTMKSDHQIIKIEKIYNAVLRANWDHELLMTKHRNTFNERIQYVRLLWNGTGSTPPNVIYESEKGWMINYSTDANLWGKGVYFSEDASYVCRSNRKTTFKYAHKTNYGTIKLFLAEVITGEGIQMDETINLPEPPTKLGTNKKFDSVIGFRHGTFIWVVKDNGRAYPTYCIEFQPGNLKVPAIAVPKEGKKEKKKFTVIPELISPRKSASRRRSFERKSSQFSTSSPRSGILATSESIPVGAPTATAPGGSISGVANHTHSSTTPHDKKKVKPLPKVTARRRSSSDPYYEKEEDQRAEEDDSKSTGINTIDDIKVKYETLSGSGIFAQEDSETGTNLPERRGEAVRSSVGEFESSGEACKPSETMSDPPLAGENETISPFSHTQTQPYDQSKAQVAHENIEEEEEEEEEDTPSSFNSSVLTDN